METQFALIMTTCGTAENARLIAKSLVEQKLVACAQVFPIESFFHWDGGVQESPEWMVFLKIKAEDYAATEAAISTLHAYEVPEIIQVAIEKGAAAYLSWIETVTRR
jgi:periplasmic divalent cation tolerance protein